MYPGRRERGSHQPCRRPLGLQVDFRSYGPGLIAPFRPGRPGRPGALVTGGASGTGAGPDSRISREDPGSREDRGDSRAPEAPRSPDPPRSFRPAIQKGAPGHKKRLRARPRTATGATPHPQEGAQRHIGTVFGARTRAVDGTPGTLEGTVPTMQTTSLASG